MGYGDSGSMLQAAASIFSNQQNINSAEEINESAAFMMRDNRNWSERMANTAHQREVADLKAAGLNPVLSATGGQGAGTPSSAAASLDTPKSMDMGGVVERALSSGYQRELLGAQVKKETANAVSAGAEAAQAAEKAREVVKGQKAKNSFIRTQEMIAKSLAPERKESLKSGSEAGGVWKAGRSILNRIGLSSAYEAATSGQWGADLYDKLHGEGE